MPLAPPVTTTILPFTCIATPDLSEVNLRQDDVEHGRVVACRAEKHEAMPDHVLEAQPLPCAEDYSETVEQATGKDKPEGHFRQRGQAGVIGDDAAPAHGKIKADRQDRKSTRLNSSHPSNS